METTIRKKRNVMLFITFVIFGLAFLQYDFIWNAIKHNLFVNVCIIATTIAGIIISFVKVSRLDNEVMALHAMEEMWADAQTMEDKTDDPIKRHYRCLKQGVVFKRPKLLGHVYDIVTEEISRNRGFRISVDTMQTLVHKIDIKLNEEKELLSYLSGLLVFLGLIGTFMGLLKMVGSIGGILSSLQMSGDASGDGFGKLLTDLQEPIGGMATGFAASLFGLCGSLVVGLLGKKAHEAASAIKWEFETWLATVSKIESDRPGESMGASVDKDVMRLMASIVADYGRSTRCFEASVAMLNRVSQQIEKQHEAAEAMSTVLQSVRVEQSTISHQLGKLTKLATSFEVVGGELVEKVEEIGAQAARDAAALLTATRDISGALNAATAHQAELAQVQKDTLGEVRSFVMQGNDVTRLSHAIGGVIGSQMGAVGEALDQSISKLRMDLSAEASTQRNHLDSAVSELASALCCQMDAASERLGSQVTQVVADELAGPLQTIGGLLRENVSEVARQSLQFIEGQQAVLGHLNKLEALDQAEDDRQSRDLEATIASGMGDISRTMETAFVAYANLLEVALARAEKAETSSAKVDEDIPVAVSEVQTLKTRDFREALSKLNRTG
jgi:hypothetical protein